MSKIIPFQAKSDVRANAASARPCDAIADAVKAGLLEPAVILDAEGHDLRGYALTDKARERYRAKGVPNGDILSAEGR